MTDAYPRFKRILLKLSGEALMGTKGFGIHPPVLKKVASEVSSVQKNGVEVAIVIGGGNIFRGLRSTEYGMERVAADQMGMLATIINAIALGEALQQAGSETRVMTAVDMHNIAEPYTRRRAIGHLSRDRIVLFGAGTGNPYFTTDTAAALRALEIGAEVLLKATKVDGVYDADPNENASAKPFTNLTYQEVLKRNLKVMDLTAISLAMSRDLPIIVFNLRKSGNIMKVVSGGPIGTIISGE